MAFSDAWRSYVKIWRYACMGAGVALLVVAGGFALHTGAFLRGARAVDGTVIGLHEVRDAEDGSVNFQPVFRFAALDGKTYTATSDTGSNPAGFDVGQKVRILYKTEDPDSARIDSFMQLWFLPIVFGAVGFVSTILGLVLFLGAGRSVIRPVP